MISDPAQSSNKSGHCGFYAYEDRKRQPHISATSYPDGFYKTRPVTGMNLQVLTAAARRMHHADKVVVITGVNV